MKTTEQQTLEFITFCTEMYAGKKNMSGNEVAKLFCDSGLGFYATTDYNQAERWVRIRMKTSQTKNGFVNKYLIDDDLLQNEKLKVLRFDCANESWLDFVVRNRSDRNFTHDYDLVFGKVANDNVYTV